MPSLHSLSRAHGCHEMLMICRAALDMLKKSVRQGGGRKLGGGKDSDGGDAPEQLRKLQLQVSSAWTAD